MDIITEAEKLQKALREIDLVQSTNGEHAANLERLRCFFSSALGDIWTELLAHLGPDGKVTAATADEP